MDNNLDKIKDKILKLMNLQKGAEEIGSMEEAANATAQISKLLAKYNLDLNAIKPRGEKSNINIGMFIIGKELGYKKTESDWMEILMNILAKHNMCKTIIMNKHYTTKYSSEYHIELHILGEQHNIELVEFMGTQLIHRIRKMRLKAFKAHTDQKKNAYYRSYCRAVNYEIAMKLKEMEDEIQKEYIGTTALVRTNELAIQEKVEKEYGELKPGKSTRLKNNVGYADGSRDGKNINVHKGIE